MIKKLLFLLWITLFFTACSKDNDNPLYQDIYEFSSIDYIIAEEDYVNELKYISPHQYKNTSHSQSIRTRMKDPNETLYESSYFLLEDLPLHTFHTDNLLKVSVPIDIVNDSVYSEKKWSFNFNEEQEELPYTRFTQRNQVTIKPQSECMVTDTIYYLDMQLTYTATFRGKETGNEILVSGKWMGQQVKRINRNIKVTGLN